MLHMYRVLNDAAIPDNAGVAIEYNIPNTSKRVDFLLSGHDGGSDSVVIVELKQWKKVEKVDGKDGIVKTVFNRGLHETNHPSYQAWSYATLIEDFNENVQQQAIDLHPCAYLHNYHKEPDDPLTDTYYQDYLTSVPVYGKGDVEKLRKFIKKHIKYGDNKSKTAGYARPSRCRMHSPVCCRATGNSL